MNIARLDLNMRAELLENHDEEIDRPSANRATAGAGQLGLARPCEKRRDDPETCSHFGDKFVGRHRIDDLARAKVDRPARVRGGARPPSLYRMIDAMMTENAQKQANVGEIRDIFKGQRFPREQRGDHQWKRRVFSAGNPYDAIQRLAADDPNTIQGTPRLQKSPN